MELANLKDEMTLDNLLESRNRPMSQLQELELALVGGGMGDVQQ